MVRISLALGGLNFNGYDYVDMGDAGYWATCNIGASSPEEVGKYFKRGDVVGCTEAEVSAGKFSSMLSDTSAVLPLEKDAAHVLMGGSWVMPTEAVFSKLISSCSFSGGSLGGVPGCFAISNTSSSNVLFFPCGGQVISGNVYNKGSIGLFWTSVRVINDGVAASTYYMGQYRDSVFSVGSGGLASNGYNIRGVIPKE